MTNRINIYCDESCHLEHDHQKVMVLGAVQSPQASSRPVAEALRALKAKHGLPPNFETKWKKVSPGLLPYYMDCLDMFVRDNRLRFRALVVGDKTRLRHEDFGQDHDTWYFKMYYTLLKPSPARTATTASMSTSRTRARRTRWPPSLTS